MKPNIPVSMVPAAGNTAVVVAAIVLGITAIVVRHVVKRAQPSNAQTAVSQSPFGFGR